MTTPQPSSSSAPKSRPPKPTLYHSIFGADTTMFYMALGLDGTPDGVLLEAAPDGPFIHVLAEDLGSSGPDVITLTGANVGGVMNPAHIFADEAMMARAAANYSKGPPAPPLAPPLAPPPAPKAPPPANAKASSK